MSYSVAELRIRKCTKFRGMGKTYLVARTRRFRQRWHTSPVYSCYPCCWQENVIVRCKEENEAVLRVMKAEG